MSDKKRIIWIDSIKGVLIISRIRACNPINLKRCLFSEPLVESHILIPHASLHGY